MTAQREAFGRLPDGRAVEAVVLTNAHGVSSRIMAYGAILQSLVVPDRDGVRADVALGHRDPAAYLGAANYFGATVGRYANRIAHGRFALDGNTYTLAQNNGPNALHGGVAGFDKALWEILAVDPGPISRVVLRHVSPDGNEGYPGTLTAHVSYALDDKGALTIVYTATSDRPTIVNLTNHSYWNLGGEGSARSALDAELTVFADSYLPVDAGLIPTGTARQVAGTPFDFRTPAVVGARVREAGDAQIAIARGYDHNYVLRGGVTATPRLVARLSDPVSGRELEMLTTEPGLQVYSGNFLDGTAIGKSGHAYRQGDGIALEAQHFPDSPNRPDYPPVRLDPGRTYTQTTIYRFGFRPGQP